MNVYEMPLRDTRLLAKALMQRWPINPKMREGIIGALARVLTDRNASHREKTAAARALMAADAQNIEIEKMTQADEHEYRANLVAIAKHLGPSEVARLASNAGVAIDAEAFTDVGAGETTPTDGEEEGK
jgi:hypothetical protein